MDVLSDVLSSVRLSGSVLFTARFTVPFSVATPDSENFARMLVPNARRLILFHIITEGRCTTRTADGGAPMLDRSDPLAEIAAGVGYFSENGFNRTFRRYFGEPPGRWRKRHKTIAPA